MALFYDCTVSRKSRKRSHPISSLTAAKYKGPIWGPGPCPSQYSKKQEGRGKQKGLSLKQPFHEHILPASKSEATCCNFELPECLAWLRKTSLTTFLDAQRPIPLGLFAKEPFFLLPHCMSCGILVPGPEFELVPPEVEAQSPNHWATREVPDGTLRLKNRVLCSAPDKGYHPRFLPWHKPLLHHKVLPSPALALSTLEWRTLSGVHRQMSSGSISVRPQFVECTSICNYTP